MKDSSASSRLVLVAVLVLSAVGACFSQGSGSSPPLVGNSGGAPATSDGGSPSGGVGGADDGPMCVARPLDKHAQCRPVSTPTSLRQRVTGSEAVESLYFTETLFGEFKSLCGTCHVSSDLGGFAVNSTTFPTVVDDKVLAAVTSDTANCELDDAGNKKDPTCYDYMPPVGSPNGKPWSQRKDSANDPVTHLSKLIKQWIEAGRPADVFKYTDDTGGPYAIDADFAETFTNLGTCLPDPGMVATELEDSCALDAKFAAMHKDLNSMLPEEQVGLPPTLDQTDMTTLDTAELARHGLIAYVPNYPLWTDDAGKLRYVRVPQGTSIKFNKQTKEFEIPNNTRFYKTFMRKVLEADGVERFRKVETRLIVSRTGEDSLFGTYLWNEQETQATLHTDPLNNAYPFKDKVLTLVTDQGQADAAKKDWMAGRVRNYTKELDYRGVVRRYAVPSSERCVQCHMGGEGGSFILGFLPLDVYARPCDQATLDANGHCDAGMYEPSGGDQLTQLERLISYGVITNYDISTDLVKLEDPQGKAQRTYRTEEELTAQGYMLGNCSHCHNPRGYPSTLNPELKLLLNFRANDHGGGIFGFPLELYSPRITRQNGTVKIPYITPSLRDVIGADTDHWKPKRYKNLSTKDPEQFIDAPWRSLIYRNVDTPFTYADDLSIFPHMPLNSPGFDCRAPRFLGEWMVSIPAVRKHPELAEDTFDTTLASERDDDPQPYREIKPDDPAYPQALLDSRTRLDTYKHGLRGDNYCAEHKDIIDVFGVLYSASGNLIPLDGQVKGLPAEGVPDRAHWVVTDVTDPPGAWNPRRSDWKKILIDQDFSSDEKALQNLTDVALADATAALTRQKATVGILHDAKPSQSFLDYARSKVPFGVWEKHADCDFQKGGVRTAAQLKTALGDKLPRWMKINPPADTDPIYETLPGAAVFGMICINCHGPNADSTGRQAVTLQEMTGGTARVANFRDGLFGPFGKGGENRKRVFGDDDLARRYLPWMALGGTRSKIPLPILDLVAATPVLGATRPQAPPVRNANMLETARELCRAVVTRGFNRPFQPATLNQSGSFKDLHSKAGLLVDIGDAELWEALCSFENPAPIHAISIVKVGLAYELFNQVDTYYEPSQYPAGMPVGNVLGGFESSLTAGNQFPWCVVKPTDPAAMAFINSAKTSDGHTISELVCPDPLLDPKNLWATDPVLGSPLLEHFATRGAINAGWAVFEYLDSMVSQGKGRIPSFNECELLAGPKP